MISEMTKKITRFEDLRIWQKSHGLAIEIYQLTRKFPKDETYGLISQLRRVSLFVPANIVEGFYRNTTKELVQFLFHARGSAGEVIYFLVLAKDLKYISNKQYLELRERYESLIKSINALIGSLKKR